MGKIAGRRNVSQIKNALIDRRPELREIVTSILHKLERHYKRVS